MTNLTELTETVGKVIESAGVILIASGALYSTLVASYSLVKNIHSSDEIISIYRKFLGNFILLGLEFLVAGDIIRTVAVKPSFTSIGILAAIVVIRTFLSFTLEVETSGKWPWQK